MIGSNLLLGYDAREDWISFQDSWSRDRRQRLLIRQDIEKPLSVDTAVWPSVFDLVPCLHRPDWTGYVQDLWEDLQALTTAVQAVELSKPICYVAIELLEEFCSCEVAEDWRERVPRVVSPDVRSLPHSLVGYDVADYYLLSGLTNCEPSLQHRSSKWAAHLNKYHLFEKAEVAFEFKAEVEARIPEHAPFFLFALWLIEPE